MEGSVEARGLESTGCPGPPAAGRKGGRPGTRLAVLLGAAVVILLLCEVGLRMAGYDPVSDVSQGRAFILRPSATPGLIYELTPGAKGTLWDSEVEINSHGFRDREYRLAKPPGVTRIVALGDSITFGNSLPAQVAWPDRLEALYAEEGKPVEVLNLGVGGYDTWQEEIALEKIGLAFDPDYVFVCYCLNDLAIVSVNLSAILGLERFRGWMGHSRLAQWVSLHLDARSLADQTRELLQKERRELKSLEVPADPVLEGLRGRLAEFMAANPRRKDLERTEKGGYDHLEMYLEPARLERVRRALVRLSELAREHDFRLVFFVHPYLDEGRGGFMIPAWQIVYEMVEHQARCAGLEVVDVITEMTAAGLAELRIEENNAIHPGIEGHDVLTRALKRQVSELPGLD
jgi:lysophospholipase L1-like esterase